MTNTPGGYYDIFMIPLIKKRSSHRIKIILGQLKGIEKMIDEEKYCIDILTQSLAVQKSLASLNRLLLENHLKTHVVHDFQKGQEEQDKTIKELLRLYSLSEIQ